jgi:hypothetical protein
MAKLVKWLHVQMVCVLLVSSIEQPSDDQALCKKTEKKLVSQFSGRHQCASLLINVAPEDARRIRHILHPQVSQHQPDRL